MKQKLPASTIIEFNYATCVYDHKEVLQDVNFSIGCGRFVGIVGPSGSGKTTLLKAMLGLVNVTKGVVEVATSDIGYVPQLESIDWNFPVTVKQVVGMGLSSQGRIWPWPSREEMKRVEVVLDMLDIRVLEQRHIRELSGGQQQKVFLARALVGNPKLLLLDEPTTGIDVKTRHALLHILKALNKKGMTIVVTTHDLNSVAAHLPWIICFNKRLIAQGPPTEIFTPQILSQTYQAPLEVIRHTGVI